MFSRLVSIYGKEKVQLLKEAKVAICGLGGVGSYTAAALARSGIENLIIIDFDIVEKSNINRQLFALSSTVGKRKVEAATDYLRDINPNVNIETYSAKINEDNVDALLSSVDYVIDCVDDVQAKIAVAKYSLCNNKYFISCMGTAMRKDPGRLEVSSIYQTSVCPLCRVVRGLARKKNLEDFPVLYSTEPAINSTDGKLGSTSYLPPIAGLMLSGFIIEKITSNDDNAKQG